LRGSVYSFALPHFCAGLAVAKRLAKASHLTDSPAHCAVGLGSVRVTKPGRAVISREARISSAHHFLFLAA
jgi:hypothetical protein